MTLEITRFERPRRGFSLVELLVVVAVIGVLVALLLPAVQAARESARRSSCANNVRQLALAVQQYVSVSNAFPTGKVTPEEDWSLHAQLLPFIEQAAVHARIDFDNVATAAINKTPIPMFLCPSDSDRMTNKAVASNQVGNARNNYRGNVGNLPRDGLVKKDAVDASGNPVKILDEGATFADNNGIFLTGVTVRLRHVTDGLSKTALLCEGRLGDGDNAAIEDPGDWVLIGLTGAQAKNRQLVYDACTAATPEPGSAKQESFSGRNWTKGNYYPTRYNHVMPPNSRSCAKVNTAGTGLAVNGDGSATTASSRHRGGVNFAVADGSTRFVNDGVDFRVWWALGSRAFEPGESVVGGDW